MSLTISSPAFSNGDTVPARYTCEGENAEPPVSVTGAPAGTRAFAIILEDPDAPGGVFTHWMAYDIPTEGETLQTGAAKSLVNNFGQTGYGGPCPPRGHGAHRYFLNVYAVDQRPLELSGTSRADLERALQSHTLARAQLVGRFERH